MARQPKSQSPSSKLPEKIREIIHHSGKSVAGFASEFGERPDKYYQYLKGATVPTWELMEKIMQRYSEVDANWLFDRHGFITLQAESDNQAGSPAGTEVALLRELLQEKERLIRLLEKYIQRLEANQQTTS